MSTLFIEFMLGVILESIKSSVKSSVKTEDEILEYFAQNPNSTIKELAEILDLSVRAIEKQIASLKRDKRVWGKDTSLAVWVFVLILKVHSSKQRYSVSLLPHRDKR